MLPCLNEEQSVDEVDFYSNKPENKKLIVSNIS